MTSLLAGVDLSTKALHMAAVPLETDHGDGDLPAAIFRSVTIPKGRDPSQRCRNVARSMRDLLRPFDTPNVHWTVRLVYVEEPFGRYRTADRALLPIFGAILGGIPHDMVATGIPVQAWRRTLGLAANLSKTAAIETAQAWLEHQRAPSPSGVDEHQAEALLVALAGRHENQKAWAA